MNKANVSLLPPSLEDALYYTKQAGKNAGLDVDAISEHLGCSKDALYKWLKQSRLPVCELVNLEKLCGTHFVTKYLAFQHGFLLVPIPTGRVTSEVESLTLNVLANETLLMLSQGKYETANSRLVLQDKLLALLELLSQQYTELCMRPLLGAEL